MKPSEFLYLAAKLRTDGFADEQHWAQSVAAPGDAQAFFCEFAWVVINSGMKYTVACLIRDRVWAALAEGRPVKEAFGHPGKAAACTPPQEPRRDGRAPMRE